MYVQFGACGSAPSKEGNSSDCSIANPYCVELVFIAMKTYLMWYQNVSRDLIGWHNGLDHI